MVGRFIDAFLTRCRMDSGRRRPGGRLLVRRSGTAGRPTRWTVPAPHESRFFAPARQTQKRKITKNRNALRRLASKRRVRLGATTPKSFVVRRFLTSAFGRTSHHRCLLTERIGEKSTDVAYTRLGSKYRVRFAPLHFTHTPEFLSFPKSVVVNVY